MKSATKDIVRTIRKDKKRFISLAVICALGVVMLTGLRAACVDLRTTSDEFFDKQGLFDLSVQSTLGLTDDDVKALSEAQGIITAEGTYSEEVYTLNNGKQQTAEMKTLSKHGINTPYIIEGELPKTADEIAVSRNYLNATGKKIGNTVVIEEKSDEEDTDDENEFVTEESESEPNFKLTEYRITASVIDPMDITAVEGLVSFRSSASTDYIFFVTPEAVQSDVYTAVYLLADGTAELQCYSDEYDNRINGLRGHIENTYKESRENARTAEIRSEAQNSLDDAKKEAEDKFSDARSEIKDAEKELTDGKSKWQDGYDELYANEKEANEQFAAAHTEIDGKYAELEAGEKQLADAEAKLEAGKAFLSAEQYSAAVNQINEQKLTLQSGRQQLDEAKTTLEESEADTKQKLADAKQELDDSLSELNDGEAELINAKAELSDKQAEADAAFADAQKEIDDIDAAVWYIQDRSSLGGYENVKSDSGCIEAIGKVFPVIFLLVAVLISLTTVTRMVEEERGLIGTYKALGFKESEIRRKYLLFTVGASLIGGIIGDIGGFIVLPEIIFTVFANMYQLPAYNLEFDFITGVGGIVLFTAGILAATLISCHAELKQTPAALMRPSSPKAGKTILIERIPFIWSRLTFLNKVTARNLFRYKKRLFMTVGGILGCTALLVCGFAIKDSVTELLPGQYENIYRYDVIAVASEPDKLYGYVGNDDDIYEWMKIYTTNVKVSAASNNQETVQLIVVPDNSPLNKYISLKNDTDGKEISLKNGGITVTKNLSVILDFSIGDSIQLQDTKLNIGNTVVDGITENYLGNTVYMNESTYTALFDTVEYNGALINCKESCADCIAFADTLSEKDGIISVVSTQALKNEFSTAFALINMVVYIIVSLAACLAFVVLFTLSTTNISERERELSTIKVLGFFDREVHLYVNKETLVLTGIGILLGLPLGTVLGHALTKALAMPSIYFSVTIHPISYVISLVLAFAFAFLVEIITDRFLDRINPVEALKSIE